MRGHFHLRIPGLMQFIRGLYNLPASPVPCALTIGNFDGLHYGHQSVLRELARAAEERNLPSSLMLFEPQPVEYFAGDKAPPRLYRCREKLLAIRQQPVDLVVMLSFNASLANLEAEDFVKQILIDRLGVKYLLVGDDFRFGRDRLGDHDLLERMAEQYGFELGHLDSVIQSGQRVSSTLIRQHLIKGEFSQAEALLGRPYRMTGKVVRGDAIGRDIGFPTINLPINRLRSPLQGVFAVKVFGVEDNRPLNGVASIGSRPTVDGKHCVLEVHLFDWSGDCYGRRVEVEFVEYLRDEEKFESMEAMTLQIQRDAERARKILANE
jgi:riboflavin kinase/FMN adenylyltransferase